MAEHLVDIRLYGEALKEAFELYLASTGLKATDKTVVTLRDDPERGICADIQNLVISPVVAQRAVQQAAPAEQPQLKKLTVPAQPVSQREVEAEPEPEAPVKPKATPKGKKIEMLDAASAEPGQLEDTKVVLMDASRFEVGPPPKGEPPRMRGGSMVRETPTDTNHPDIDSRFHTKPVEGLEELTVRGKVIASGKMSDLPDHGALPTE